MIFPISICTNYARSEADELEGVKQRFAFFFSKMGLMALSTLLFFLFFCFFGGGVVGSVSSASVSKTLYLPISHRGPRYAGGHLQ